MHMQFSFHPESQEDTYTYFSSSPLHNLPLISTLVLSSVDSLSSSLNSELCSPEVNKTFVLCLSYHFLCCIPESAFRQASGAIWEITFFIFFLCRGHSLTLTFVPCVTVTFLGIFCLVFSLFIGGQLWAQLLCYV